MGPGGEQVRKGEGLEVEGQQYKAGWEGCQIYDSCNTFWKFVNRSTYCCREVLNG